MNYIEKFIKEMRDPKQRKLFGAIFAGKLIGVGLCFLVMFGISVYFSSTAKVHAQDAKPPEAAPAPAAPAAEPAKPAEAAKTPEAAPAAPAAAPAAPDAAAPAAPPPPNPPYVNPINTMWVLVTAFLVFFMQAGFMFLEAGFSRTRESVNVMLEGIVDTSLCGILFYCWGFAWMFGHGNGFIGLGRWQTGIAGFACKTCPIPMKQPASRRWRSSCSSSPLPTPARRLPRARWLAAPDSGATFGIALGVSGFIYPIFGHWAWGPDGWLTPSAARGIRSFLENSVP
jgi:Amt family ammonium transporter